MQKFFERFKNLFFEFQNKFADEENFALLQEFTPGMLSHQVLLLWQQEIYHPWIIGISSRASRKMQSSIVFLYFEQKLNWL